MLTTEKVEVQVRQAWYALVYCLVRLVGVNLVGTSVCPEGVALLIFYLLMRKEELKETKWSYSMPYPCSQSWLIGN